MGNRAVAVVKTSRSRGVKQLEYICRLEALRPSERGSRQITEAMRSSPEGETVYEIGSHKRQREHDLEFITDSSADSTLSHETIGHLEQFQEDLEVLRPPQSMESLWTWNAPVYVTGDKDGTDKSPGKESKVKRHGEKASPHKEKSPLPEKPFLTLEEKIENATAYFSLLSDSEKRRGGVNSYRIILTTSRPTSDQEMRAAVNSFLRENFPSAQALITLHRNTDHLHAHVYVHTRQLDGKKLDLKQGYFHLDESWAKVCSKQFRDPVMYEEHMRLKAETLEHRRQEKLARQEGKELPVKPERWADKFDVKNGVAKPWDDRWVGRLQASARVAKAKVEYLKIAGTPDGQLEEAKSQAQALEVKLTEVAEKRVTSESVAKQSLPAEIITLEEQKELALYASALKEYKLTLSKGSTAGRGTAKVQQLVQTVLPFEIQPTGQLAFGFNARNKEKTGEKETKLKNRSGAGKSKLSHKQPHQLQEHYDTPPASQRDYRSESTFAQKRLERISWRTEEERLKSAQSFVLEALRYYGQDEGLLDNPQQYTILLSAKVREDLAWKFGLSVQGLGYTREAWANTVMVNARSVLGQLHEFNEQATLCREQINRTKESLDRGEERALSAISGPNTSNEKSHSYGHSVSSNSHERGEGREHEVMDKEHVTTDRHEHVSDDRLEHFLSR